MAYCRPTQNRAGLHLRRASTRPVAAFALGTVLSAIGIPLAVADRAEPFAEGRQEHFLQTGILLPHVSYGPDLTGVYKKALTGPFGLCEAVRHYGADSPHPYR
jgi:hypothetical protein